MYSFSLICASFLYKLLVQQFFFSIFYIKKIIFSINKFEKLLKIIEKLLKNY
ncbi:hypothetical protein BGAPBR_B0019 (plasmid) [Borreliella garinii PBr]|uniref:Uncharacterized protein n=1 Tax=Borreliella garinii PBr TaxID=498743 RepID=B8F167_BORGR|nr:hypothetical protein BGAPBR_B0019 [Borreliella garinii PBr]